MGTPLFGPTGSPDAPRAVRFVVGDFASLFGSQGGAELRAWCLERKWLLLWALGAGGDPVFGSWVDPKLPVVRSEFNGRVVDLHVLKGLAPVGNATKALATVENLAAIDQQWDHIQMRRDKGTRPPSPPNQPEPGSSGFNSSVWTRWFRDLPFEMRVASLSAGDCADTERCVGMIVKGGTCLCYADAGDNDDRVNGLRHASARASY